MPLISSTKSVPQPELEWGLGSVPSQGAAAAAAGSWLASALISTWMGLRDYMSPSLTIQVPGQQEGYLASFKLTTGNLGLFLVRVLQLQLLAAGLSRRERSGFRLGWTSLTI